MSFVKIYEQKMVDIDLIDLSEENPNEQTDDELSALVEEIIEHGWIAPVQLIGPYDDGRYKMVGGEHRLKVARVLGMEQIPAIPIPVEDWDDDVRKVQLVKQNILHGQLNPEKFTKLYEQLTAKYEADVVKRMMGFTREDAFNRVYEDTKKALPPEMQEKLESVRDELKTVDDLSLVLNRLFTQYGNTLDFNYMFFSWGGKTNVMIELRAPGSWQRVKKFLDWCQENGQLADEALMARMDWPT